MPLRNSVSCLQFLALQKVCNYVLDVALEMKKDSIGSREYFIKSTHAWARTNIISCTKEKL